MCLIVCEQQWGVAPSHCSRQAPILKDRKKLFGELGIMLIWDLAMLLHKHHLIVGTIFEANYPNKLDLIISPNLQSVAHRS